MKVQHKKSNTCLAVIKHEGKLYFGSDRRVSWGMSKAQRCVRPKTVKRDGIVLAGTGSGYMCDLMCELLPLPKLTKKDTTFMYANTKLLPATLNFLHNKGMLHKDYNVLIGDRHHNDDAVILVGIRADLYELVISYSGISISPIDTPYAHGCGGMYALGSLLTTALGDEILGPEKRLHIAIMIAGQVSPGCDTECDIVIGD